MANECKIAILDNSNGELCTSYPSKIIIPTEFIEPPSKEEKYLTVRFQYDPFKVEIKEVEKEKTKPLNIDSSVDLLDEKTLSSVSFVQLVNECKFCRVHGRFPVPVIFYGQKYISRSGTISRGAESVFRNISTSVKNFLFSDTKQNSSIGTNMLHQRYIRQWDAELLKRLKCKHIIDLMVENKKVKYGVTVCTSEKAEKVGIYNNLDIQVFPYPGRESFVFKGRSEKKQYQFRWSDSGTCDSEFSTTMDLNKIFPEMDAKNYRDWDLVQITQNYLLMILHILGKDNDEGVLVHCVSGWDRTPLFISLLRITLWADGEIHHNLNIDQLLYLTIAYDWMLFNHDLQERLKHFEEVFKFCFDFLQFIESEDFSIFKFKKVTLEENTKELLKKVRVMKLKDLRERFFVFYRKIVKE